MVVELFISIGGRTLTSLRKIDGNLDSSTPKLGNSSVSRVHKFANTEKLLISSFLSLKLLRILVGVSSNALNELSTLASTLCISVAGKKVEFQWR